MYIAAVLAVTVAGGMLRAVRLDHPMRYDEAFTFLFFAFPPDPGAWFNYVAPNNHVLHTLMMHLVIQVGGLTPWVIRMPAFLAGVAIIPASAWLGVQITGKRLAGICAAGLVGASSLLIEYSVNARGYSLVCLLTLTMGTATAAICRDLRKRKPWFAWIALAAAGTFTIPIMLYPIAVFTLLIVLQSFVASAGRNARGVLIRRLLLALSAACALTVVLYLPVMSVSGVRALLANEYVRPLAMSEVLDRLPKVAAETLRHWTRDTSVLWEVLVGGGLVSAVACAVCWRRIILALPILAVILLVCATFGHRVVPFPRVWLFVLPLVLVCASCGLTLLVERISLGRARWTGPLLLGPVLAVAVGLAAARTLARPFLISEDPCTLVDAEAITRDLNELYDGQTAVASQVPAWPSLGYYSFLRSARPFIRYQYPVWPRVVLVVGDRQTLEGVFEANEGLREHYDPPRLWRTYPHADVYLIERRTTPGSRGITLPGKV